VKVSPYTLQNYARLAKRRVNTQNVVRAGFEQNVIINSEMKVPKPAPTDVLWYAWNTQRGAHRTGILVAS